MNLPKGAFNSGDIKAYRLLMQRYQPTSLTEIGCWRGRSICSIATEIKTYGIKVNLVDNFSQEGLDLQDRIDFDVRSDLEASLKRFELMPYVTIYEMDSVEAAKVVPETDITFIDGDHSPAAVEADIDAWFQKTKEVIAGHDYVRNAKRKSLMYQKLKTVVDTRFGKAVRKFSQQDAPMNKIWVVHINEVF